MHEEVCHRSDKQTYYYIIDVAAPTNVTAEQNDPIRVLVMWTPAPRATGYQVQVTVGTTTTTTNVAGTIHTIPVINQPGTLYSIRVMSLSQHFPSEASEPVQVTVRGMGTTVSFKFTNCMHMQVH